MTIPDLLIDLSTHEFRLQGRPLRLSLTEARLLLKLLESPGVMVRSVDLARHLWGDLGDNRPIVRKNIYRLRMKLEDDCVNPRWIARVSYTGYKYIGPRALVYGHSDYLPYAGPVQEQQPLFALAGHR